MYVLPNPLETLVTIYVQALSVLWRRMKSKAGGRRAGKHNEDWCGHWKNTQLFLVTCLWDADNIYLQILFFFFLGGGA